MTAEPPRLESIMLIVSDLGSAMRFYAETLGFSVLSHFPGDYASLSTPGGVLLGLHVPHDGHAHRVETGGAELSFTVDDVDACYARLSTAGVRFAKPPTDMSWGAREAHALDPDGHVLSFKSALRRA